MRLFITRHGQIMSNRKGEFASYTDYPLTEKGKEQAGQLKKRLSHNKISRIYSSPSKRCIETAEVFGKKIILDKRLRELNFGIFEGNTKSEVRKTFKELFLERNKNKFQFRIPEGESYKDVFFRAYSFFDEIYEKNQSILLVTHATTLKMILFLLTSRPLNTIDSEFYDNCCLFCFDLVKEGYHYKTKEIFYNETRHIG